MSLIKCVECKKEIANDAEKCPNCGARTVYAKNLRDKIKKIILLTAVLLILVFISIFLIINQKKDNDRIIGTWVDEKVKYNSFIISRNPYQTGQYKTTTIDSFTFNEDGTCVNDFNILSEYIGSSQESSSPCKYKVNGNKITITWLDDNYWDGDKKTLTMPFVFENNYIVFDNTRYERK